MLVFDNAIKSEATRKAYHYALRKFCEWAKISTPEGLLQLKTDFLQQILEDYLFHMKKRLSTSSIRTQINAIDLFLTLNDKEVRIKKLKKMYPETSKAGGGGFWSNEQIKTMLDGESLRNKLIVNILCASGVRVGSLPLLKIEHVSNVEYGCKKIIVYFGTKDEYIAFVNASCSKLLDSYIESRRTVGESIKGSSPLLRSSFRIGIEPVKPMSYTSIKLVLYRMACKVRGKNYGKYVRHSQAMSHSYRTRFITLCKSADNANISLIEKLAGHSGVVKLDNSYFKPSAAQLLGEYAKHMNTLMIDESQRIIQNQQEKISELQDNKDREIAELKQDIRNLYELLGKEK